MLPVDPEIHGEMFFAGAYLEPLFVRIGELQSVVEKSVEKRMVPVKRPGGEPPSGRKIVVHGNQGETFGVFAFFVEIESYDGAELDVQFLADVEAKPGFEEVSGEGFSVDDGADVVVFQIFEKDVVVDDEVEGLGLSRWREQTDRHGGDHAD